MQSGDGRVAPPSVSPVPQSPSCPWSEIVPDVPSRLSPAVIPCCRHRGTIPGELLPRLCHRSAAKPPLLPAGRGTLRGPGGCPGPRLRPCPPSMPSLGSVPSLSSARFRSRHWRSRAGAVRGGGSGSIAERSSRVGAGAAAGGPRSPRGP